MQMDFFFNSLSGSGVYQLHFICTQILDATRGVACKSAAEWQAEMLERVFFPHLLFALGADLKLLLWHSLCCSFY